MEFKIEDGCLKKCKGEETIAVIPEGVTQIGSQGSFDSIFDCPNLLRIDLPSTLKTIASMAFNSLPFGKVQEIHVPSIEVLLGLDNSAGYPYGASVLVGDAPITSVNVPAGTKSIPKHCFESCQSLVDVVLPESLEEIGESAFERSGIQTLCIPDSVKNIGKDAFSGCAELTQMTLPESLLEIEDTTFAFCKKLSEIKIGNKVKRIGERAFMHCTSLETITIPESVQTIAKLAFYGCTALKELNYSPDHTKFDEFPELASYPEPVKCVTSGGIKTYLELPIEVSYQFSKYDDEALAYIGLYQKGKGWKDKFESGVERGGKETVNNVIMNMINILPKYGKVKKAQADKVLALLKKYSKDVEPSVTKAVGAFLTANGIGGETINQDGSFKTANQLVPQDVIKKEKSVADKWVAKRVKDVSVFDTIKAPKGADVSAVDAVKVILYEYGKQLAKNPAYHAKTWKTDIVELSISPAAECLVKSADIKGLLKIIEQNTPSLIVPIDNEKDYPYLEYSVPMIGKAFKLTPQKVEEEANGYIVSYFKPYLNSPEFFAPYARYADAKSINNLIATADTLMKSWSVAGRTIAIAIRSALMLSETKEAITYISKCGLLGKYADMRGKTEQEIRNSLTSDTGLKNDGSMGFDL